MQQKKEEEEEDNHNEESDHENEDEDGKHAYLEDVTAGGTDSSEENPELADYAVSIPSNIRSITGFRRSVSKSPTSTTPQDKSSTFGQFLSVRSSANHGNEENGGLANYARRISARFQNVTKRMSKDELRATQKEAFENDTLAIDMYMSKAQEEYAMERQIRREQKKNKTKTKGKRKKRRRGQKYGNPDVAHQGKEKNKEQ